MSSPPAPVLSYDECDSPRLGRLCGNDAGGGIAGIVLACLAVAGLLMAGVWFLVNNKVIFSAFLHWHAEACREMPSSLTSEG